MYKLLAIFLAVIAVAVAAPQILIATSSGHIPYTNGWTDGPNNGIGPVVLVHGLGGLHQLVV